MLPRKRAGEGEAVNVSDSKNVKRQRVVSSTEDSNTQVKNSSATSSDSVGNSNCSGNSSESTVTDMAFDNGTPREIVVGRCFCEGGMQKQGIYQVFYSGNQFSWHWILKGCGYTSLLFIFSRLLSAIFFTLASDKCQKEKRKTVNGDDLLWAMATLGFEEYIASLKVYLARYREFFEGFYSKKEIDEVRIEWAELVADSMVVDDDEEAN